MAALWDLRCLFMWKLIFDTSCVPPSVSNSETGWECKQVGGGTMSCSAARIKAARQTNRMK